MQQERQQKRQVGQFAASLRWLRLLVPDNTRV